MFKPVIILLNRVRGIIMHENFKKFLMFYGAISLIVTVFAGIWFGTAKFVNYQKIVASKVVINQFFELYNKKEYNKIYDDFAAQEFKTAMQKDKSTELLSKISQKIGDFKSRSKTNITVINSPIGKLYEYNMNTIYEKDKNSGATFRVKEEKGKFKIVYYFFRSPLLTNL